MIYTNVSEWGCLIKGERLRSPKAPQRYYCYLLFWLDKDFLCDYRYYYFKNNIYIFYKKSNRAKLQDLFVIYRSSEKCFNISYVNLVNDTFYFGSCRTAKKVAKIINIIYKKREVK